MLRVRFLGTVPQPVRLAHARRGGRLRAEVLGALLLPLALAGCQMDTEIHTQVKEDGSVTRSLLMQLKGLERTKEKETYPGKRFRLPAAPAWNLTADQPGRLEAHIEVEPGRPIPGGYERELAVLKRVSRNEVRLAVRDHFIAQSYRYEERFTDTVCEEEFRKELMAAYDRSVAGMLARFEKELAADYDLAPAREYAQKDLRKLFEDSGQRTFEGGVWSAVGSAIFRMAFGGFPFKKVTQLWEADPREIFQALVVFVLDKAALRKDAASPEEDQAHEALVARIVSGTVDEQRAAQEAARKTGSRIINRLEAALRKAAPKTGAAARLDETLRAIREQLAARRLEVVKAAAQEVEDYYLNPPAEQRAEREATLARMLGAHVEGNLAAMEYLFLIRLTLPGELVSYDENGYKTQDGSLRWNFNAVHFFHKPKLCQARSRVWHEERVKALGKALLGEGGTLNLRQRAELEEGVAQLDDPAAEKAALALAACAREGSREPLETFAKLATGPEAEWAKKLLETLGKASDK